MLTVIAAVRRLFVCAPAFLVPLLLAPCLAGCGGTAKAPAAEDLAQNSGVTGPEYIIGPGDSLNVFVYHVPDLSVSVPVRPDGRVSLPLISDIDAAGKTPVQLARDVKERLKEFVKDANVTIMVTSFIGPFDKQIRVIGEATQPLALPFRDHMTALDVIIEAKGLTRFAAGNSAQIIRRSNGKLVNIPVRLSDLIRDGDITQNVDMQAGDTLIIPQTWF